MRRFTATFRSQMPILANYMVARWPVFCRSCTMTPPQWRSLCKAAWSPSPATALMIETSRSQQWRHLFGDPPDRARREAATFQGNPHPKVKPELLDTYVALCPCPFADTKIVHLREWRLGYPHTVDNPHSGGILTMPLHRCPKEYNEAREELLRVLIGAQVPVGTKDTHNTQDGVRDHQRREIREAVETTDPRAWVDFNNFCEVTHVHAGAQAP